MQKLIKDNAITENQWQLALAPEEGFVATEPTLLPIEFVKNANLELPNPNIGLLIQSGDDISEAKELINSVDVVALYFKNFMDGRSFSQARIIREQFGYGGELRASGFFIRDQLLYLKRCGVNAFDFSENALEPEQAKDSLDDFTNFYQAGVDQPQPLYRRRLES